MKKRCGWVKLSNTKYLAYHDEEWGRTVHDDRVFLEFLILEWAQAGLSWETILNKRKNYREAFDGFDPVKVAAYDESKIQELLQNEWIVRNKLKVRSTVKNAQVFLTLQKEFWSFSDYVWSFVNHEQIINKPKNLSDVLVTSPESDALSKDLKKRWMSFVGSTIIYGFMQATGLVDDHEVSCFCKK